MKRRLLLLLILCLVAAPALVAITTGARAQEDTCQPGETGPDCTPDAPDTPDTPDAPDTPDTPDAPDTPNPAEKPNLDPPSEPDIPTTPSNPDQPTKDHEPKSGLRELLDGFHLEGHGWASYSTGTPVEPSVGYKEGTPLIGGTVHFMTLPRAAKTYIDLPTLR
jgi:hypothetical protein